MSRNDDLWAALEAQDDERWERVAEKMRAAGFCPYTRGGVLLVPTNRAVGSLPWWAMWSVKHDDLMMTRLQPVDPEHLRPRYAEHEGPLLDLDALLGQLVTAVLKHAERGGADDEAGVEEVKDIQRRVRQMIAAEKGVAAEHAKRADAEGSRAVMLVRQRRKLLDLGRAVADKLDAGGRTANKLAQAHLAEEAREIAAGFREHLPNSPMGGVAPELVVTGTPTGLQPIETIEYWAEAYSDPASGPHFMGHGMVVVLLREYAALRRATEAGKAAGQGEAAATMIPLPVHDTVTRP